VNVEIYTQAIRCNSEEELQEYARKNLNRPFTDLEITALMKVIVGRRSTNRRPTDEAGQA
jgi:hypothetical protein